MSEPVEFGIEEKKVEETEEKKRFMEDINDFPTEILEEESEEEDGEEEESQSLQLNRAVLKSISRRSSFCKVLKFLYDHYPEPYMQGQIEKSVGIMQATLWNIFKKLREIGLVRLVPNPIDRCAKFYALTDKVTTKKIVNRYLWLCGYKLAKLLPFNQTVTIEELKRNEQFQSMCQNYGLTIDEGISSLENCSRKIEVVENYGKVYGFKRKE